MEIIEKIKEIESKYQSNTKKVYHVLEHLSSNQKLKEKYSLEFSIEKEGFLYTRFTIQKPTLSNANKNQYNIYKGENVYSISDIHFKENPHTYFGLKISENDFALKIKEGSFGIRLNFIKK